MTHIEELLAKLNPKTAAAFRVASEVENELLPTPSLGLNMAIGGFGYGRQTTIWGNRSGGKTLMCLQTAANAQRDGKGVAWIDAEKNFDKKWATRLGVNTDEMAVSTITSVADMADAGFDLIKAGFDVLVVDSISVLLPQSYFEDAKDTKGGGEMKALANTGQIGTFSKNIGTALNMFNNINQHTAIILISQVRNQIGSYGASLTPMGGMALQHMNSTQIKLWSNPNIKEAKMGDVQVGDIIIKKPIGREVTWTVEKNRGPGMNMSNTYDLYFGGPNVGIDLASEIANFGIEYGIIKKAGNWLTYGEMEKGLNGKPAFVKYLHANPEIQEKIYMEIMEKAS